jgi:hypothetical protein
LLNLFVTLFLKEIPGVAFLQPKNQWDIALRFPVSTRKLCAGSGGLFKSETGLRGIFHVRPSSRHVTEYTAGFYTDTKWYNSFKENISGYKGN